MCLLDLIICHRIVVHLDRPSSWCWKDWCWRNIRPFLNLSSNICWASIIHWVSLRVKKLLNVFWLFSSGSSITTQFEPFTLIWWTYKFGRRMIRGREHYLDISGDFFLPFHNKTFLNYPQEIWTLKNNVWVLQYTIIRNLIERTMIWKNWIVLVNSVSKINNLLLLSLYF